MTHMDADHWQKEGEQFLYKWYLKITKLERDWRPGCTRRRRGRRDRGVEIRFLFYFIYLVFWGGGMVSGHFHKRTAGLMMIHCVQLGFETVQMGERKPKQMEKKLARVSVQIWTLRFFKSLSLQRYFQAAALLCSSNGLPECDLDVWKGTASLSLVDCWKGSTGFMFLYLFLAHIFHPRSHLGEHIYYCMDIHYRAAGNTAGKHGSPVAFSSRWKHSSATAAVALETWSLSLFYPHSSPLASLSALLPAIRIKPAAGLAVLKHSLQLNTLK